MLILLPGLLTLYKARGGMASPPTTGPEQLVLDQRLALRLAEASPRAGMFLDMLRFLDNNTIRVRFIKMIFFLKFL